MGRWKDPSWIGARSTSTSSWSIRRSMSWARRWCLPASRKTPSVRILSRSWRGARISRREHWSHACQQLNYEDYVLRIWSCSKTPNGDTYGSSNSFGIVSPASLFFGWLFKIVFQENRHQRKKDQRKFRKGSFWPPPRVVHNLYDSSTSDTFGGNLG